MGKSATFISKKDQPKLLDSQLKRLDCQNSCAELASDFAQWCMAHRQRKPMGIFNQAQLLLGCQWLKDFEQNNVHVTLISVII